MKKQLLIAFLLICSISNLRTFAQNASTYNAYVPLRYFQMSLDLVKVTSGFSPPVASRAFSYLGLGLYESVVPGIPGYQSGDGILPGLTAGSITDPTGNLHYPTVANNAMAFLIDSLFPNMSSANRAALYALRDSFNTAFSGNPNYANSKTFGEAIGLDVFNYSKTDGGYLGHTRNFPASFTPPSGPGLWVPTPPAFQNPPLQPYWGSNRTYVTENSTSEIPGAHVAYDETVGSLFYNYAYDVYIVGNNLTTDQQNIANFWADGAGTVTPPGHSISILNQFIIARNENLADAALAYAKLGMALSDAFVNCWKTKYIYNLMRPITYIRAHINASWNSYIATPPFPEYTSGHSTQSGAFCAVMNSIYGPTTGFTDQTHGSNFGGPRTFSNFESAANEAAVSRLYGGIHYSFSNDLGVTIGKKIGSNINALFANKLKINPMANAALLMSVDKSQAQINDTVTITIHLLNTGLTQLTNLQIKNNLPASLQLLSAAPLLGTFNNGTGIWSIPTIEAGVPSTSITLKAKIIADGVPYNWAEIIAMSEPDENSTPNNQVLTEDDYASVCLSVPIEMCNPNLTLTAPTGYSSYQWYFSKGDGFPFNPISGATSNEITVSDEGHYLFTVDGGILGSCGSQLCCPIIVEKKCCPAKVCLPVKIVRS